MADLQSQTEKAAPQRRFPFAVIFCVLILSWMAICISVHPFSEPDLFWQLRVGHDIVHTGHPPHSETYSWDRYGTPWSVSEWVTFVLYYETYRWLDGFAGLLALRIVLNVVTITLLFVLLRKSTRSSAVSLIIASASEAACANFFQTRPYQFSFILFVVLAYIISRVRAGDWRHRYLLWIAPMVAIWANLHQGFVLAIVILAFFSVADIGQWLVERVRGRVDESHASALSARSFFLTALASTLASLVSPYGFQPFAMVFSTITSPISRFIIEWMPLSLAPSVGTISLSIVALIVVAGLVSSRRFDLGTLLVVITLAVEAVEHQRNVPIFALVAPILVAQGIAQWLIRFRLNEEPYSRIPLYIAAVASTWNVLMWTASARNALAPVGGAQSAQSSWFKRIGDYSVMLTSEPIDAATFIENEQFPTDLRMFNDLGSGGYLIWRLPKYRVFIDGRNDPYFGGVLENYYAATSTHTSAEFFRIVAGYRFDAALTRNAFIQSCFRSSPDWVCVYAGSSKDGNRIYLRKSDKTAALIARCLAACKIVNDRDAEAVKDK